MHSGSLVHVHPKNSEEFRLKFESISNSNSIGIPEELLGIPIVHVHPKNSSNVLFFLE